MRSDGRQVFPLSWWARVLRWLATHPLVGVFLALAATVGVQGTRLRYRDRRAARLQDAADRERMRLARDRARTRETGLERRIVEADARARAAQDTDAQAGTEADSAAGKREEIARRWRP